MKNKGTSTRSSLFLIELIFSILILALCATVCVRIYAISWQNRKTAREWNHIQVLLTNTAEILEATDGSLESFLTYQPLGTIDNDHISYYYTSEWVPTDSAQSFYELTLTPERSGFRKSLSFCITHVGTEPRILYETGIAYPVFPDSEKEAEHEKTE